MRRLAICVLGLVACDARDRGPTRRAAGATTPRDGGSLRFSTKDAVRTLDPAQAGDEVSLYVVHPLFDTLLGYAPGSVQLVPRLASRWELAPDGLTYHFWLRDGIRFGDGRAIVAADFAYALDRALALKDSAAPAFLTSVAGAEDVISGKVTHCAGVTAIGERELEIRLASPNAAFHYVLAMVFTAPQRADHVAAAGDQLRRRPLATGPYRLREWDEGRRVVLERNPYYDDRGRQHLDEIVMLENVPRDVQLLMFERGELDAAERLSAPDQLWLLEQAAWRDHVHRRAQLVAFGMRMNVRVPPFDDVRVRRALNHGLNKQSIVKLMTGRAIAAHGLLPPAIAGHDDTIAPYPHDPAKARALLAEAGYGPGHPLVLDYVTIADEDAEKLAASMQGDLADIGVTVNITLMSFATWSSVVGTPGGPPFSYTGWLADSPDPSSFFDPVFRSRPAGAETSTNDTFYANPALDQLLDDARAERDPDRRAALYRRADRIVHDDAPWIWSYHEQLTEVVQPDVRGDTLHPIWVRDYAAAWFDRDALD